MTKSAAQEAATEIDEAVIEINECTWFYKRFGRGMPGGPGHVRGGHEGGPVEGVAVFRVLRGSEM